ncbi:leucine-rich repeat domain-containing protein [Flavobacterium sp. 3HN19-14]|uniref:leucine-rich repeat domain-containing protein n=1 Tax=Flavobacterium sp. 3HN19-14 TaxID=3448133 RepID=UPI003EDF6E12
MKKITLLLLFLTAFAQAQIVNIPDAGFKQALISAGVDANNDGNIQNSEALAVTSISIPAYEISITDMTGIASFLNLNTLICSGNNITSLDVTALSNLITLNCSDNSSMNTLNVNGLANLQYLNCSYNHLSALNLSGLNNLTYLNTNQNFGILELNVSGLTHLETLNCDGNYLSALDVSTLTNLEKLSCYGNQITVLDVSALTNLTELNCSQNQISVLNVSALTSLTKLFCPYNTIAVLDVSNLVNLTSLQCHHNQISVLDVPALTNLIDLDCGPNMISNLDVAPLINLQSLGCSQNNLSTLNVSPLTNLTSLYCTGNTFSSLDVSTLSQLQTLYVGNSQLTALNFGTISNIHFLNLTDYAATSIDLSHFTNMDAISLSSNTITTLDLSASPLLDHISINSPSLTYLNIKNGGTNISYFHIDGLALQYVCANEQNIALVKQGINDFYEDPPPVEVNSYCSFTPGNVYNTINGTVRFDANANGCDNADGTFSNIRIGISDGVNSGATYTNLSGNYSFPVEMPNITLTPSIENPSYFNFTPATATVNFPTNNNSTQTRNFCITANGIHNDIEIVIVPYGSCMPGFDAHYHLIYKNKGNQVSAGTVSFTFDDARLDYVSATPTQDAIATGLLQWNFTNLQPFETRFIDIVLNVN